MRFKTLSDFSWRGKKALVRSDLNSPIVNGKIIANDRIEESAKTIKELKKKGARVVVLSHQSRPGKKDFRGLGEHAKLLNKYVKVKFVNKIVSPEGMKNGDVVLLGNVRNLKEEFKPSTKNKMVKMFKDYDVYVNDAFSVSHRNQTSIVSFPKVMKSCIGRLMEKELKSLEKIKVKDCLFVLGGMKMEEVVNLVDGKRKVLAGGMLGMLIMYANGQRFGMTDKYIRRNKRYFKKLRNPKNVIVAIDYGIFSQGRRKNLMLDEFPSKHQALDIGYNSMALFTKEIKKAKRVFVKGSMGRAEDKIFSEGTIAILKAVAESKAFSVVGGGHTTSTLDKMGINKKEFNYISLSGGALADYISGKRLPGLEALKRK
jgi:phosphoglycerate kinase